MEQEDIQSSFLLTESASVGFTAQDMYAEAECLGLGKGESSVLGSEGTMGAVIIM